MDAANLSGSLVFSAEFWSNLVFPAAKFVKKLVRFPKIRAKFVRNLRVVRSRAFLCVSCVFLCVFCAISEKTREIWENARIFGARNFGFFARNFAPIDHHSHGTGGSEGDRGGTPPPSPN